MNVQEFFKDYDVFFNSIREITVTRTLDGYRLKISCQKGRYRVLICEDHWAEDDFEIITVGFKRFSVYAWSVNLDINAIVPL